MMSLMRRAMATVTLLALTAVGGCGDDVATPKENTMTPDTRSATPSPSPSVTGLPGSVSPEEALALGGLELPASSSDTIAERVDVATLPWLEAYRVSFTAPRTSALQICREGGLTGDLPSSGLTRDDQDLLGPDAAHVAGTRKCSGLWPEDTAWRRIAVISPGDPATVSVAIAKMGR